MIALEKRKLGNLVLGGEPEVYVHLRAPAGAGSRGRNARNVNGIWNLKRKNEILI